MLKLTNKRGGKRAGAGRPPTTEKKLQVTIRLTKSEHAAYTEQGGMRWLRRMINELILEIESKK
jgi:hypothetical protein